MFTRGIQNFFLGNLGAISNVELIGGGAAPREEREGELWTERSTETLLRTVGGDGGMV